MDDVAMMPVFQSEFRIGDRPVGVGHPCLVIAEAGVAHFGDMDLARQLVDLAADGGADVFKTQFFDVDALIADGCAEWKERLRPRNLTLADAGELKERCAARGLLFMATAHDETRIDWLRQLEVPAVKIGSGERNNTPFMRKLAALGKPVILSTGMYSQADVVEALDALGDGGCREVALLHCVTSYPTPPEDVNLRAMDALAGLFAGPVGFSDHTIDHLAVLCAVARGATIIEKHITILRDVPNAQDWKVSCGPEDFGRFVTDIRRVEAMLGRGGKQPAACESAGMQWALKSLVAARPLAAGTILTAADLTAKRPAGGVPPSRLDQVIGRSLSRALERDQALSDEDLQ